MQKTVRIDLRATDEDKQTLTQAAQLRKVSLTDFILNASRVAAEQVLSEPKRWVLTIAQMKNLNQALDAEPSDIPRLRELFQRPSPFSS